METGASRRRPAGMLAAAGAILCLAVGASPALAVNQQLKEEFAPFLDCPTATAGICVVGKTTSGEFQMGFKNVPISKTITLQGGLPSFSTETETLIPARDGNTLSNTPLQVPGGLIGIELIGGEVTATAELAGKVEVSQYSLVSAFGTAVSLPLKVKLSNPILGEECYIGSDSEPIVLHLTDGTTSPPPPNKPITGSKGTLTTVGKKKIIQITGNTLVDNSFSVPAARGCGSGLLAPVITALVNVDAGLPSAGGRNRAIMSGSFEQTEAKWALKYAKPPKEKKK